MVAFIAFLLSVTVFAFKEFGLLPYNTGTTYAMPVGSMLIVVLLSIALGDRINQFKRETAKAREEKLRISRLNEQIVVEQNQQQNCGCRSVPRRWKRRTIRCNRRWKSCVSPRTNWCSRRNLQASAN